MKKTLPIVFCLASLVLTSFADIGSALTNGANYLLSKQAADGHWSDPQMPALTALPLWALTLARPSGEATSQSLVSEALKKASAFVLATQRPDDAIKQFILNLAAVVTVLLLNIPGRLLNIVGVSSSVTQYLDLSFYLNIAREFLWELFRDALRPVLQLFL